MDEQTPFFHPSPKDEIFKYSGPGQRQHARGDEEQEKRDNEEKKIREKKYLS
jgi:hypothetical protein